MSEIKMNLSTIDRFIRIIVGGALLLAVTYAQLPATLYWIAIVGGLILMLTGLAGFCPIYSLLRVSTKK